MQTMIRVAALIFVLTPIASLQAAELSPWLGSAEQTPFQLDPVTMVAVTFAADPLQTGSTGKAPCPPAGCTPAFNTATEVPEATGAPKN